MTPGGRASSRAETFDMVDGQHLPASPIDNRLPGIRRRLGVLLSFSSDRCHGTNRLRITERGDAFPPACGLFGNGRYSPTQYSFEKVRTYIFPPAMAGVA